MATRCIRLVVADDHVAMREALAGLIDAQEDMIVVAQASDGKEALQQTRRLRPDLLLVDLSMPHLGGIPTIERVCEELPDVRAVALTMHADPSFLQAVLAAGGSGFVSKQAASQEVLAAIREVACGRVYVKACLGGEGAAPSVAETDACINDAALRLACLSERERQVLRLVALGYTSKEVAQRLAISRPSVDTYRLRVAEKLALRHRADLVRFALAAGLLREQVRDDELA